MHDRWETTLRELWRRSRFASYFYQSVHFIEEPSLPTIALTIYASRFTLFYNDTFIEQIDNEELIGLLIHEMLHIIHNHDHRAFSDEDTHMQNLAQDMVINSYILGHASTFFSRKGMYAADVPPITLPRGLPRIPATFFKEQGDTDPRWEDIFRWLKARQKRLPSITIDGDPCDPGPGEPLFSSRSMHADRSAAGDRSDIDPADDDHSREGLDGISFFDEQGNPLPTGLHLMKSHDLKYQIDAGKKRILSFAMRDSTCRDERIYQDLRGIISGTEEVDTNSWRRMIKSIADYSSQSNAWTYTYSRFNRRYFAGGVYAPGRTFQHRQNITVAVDVSGSMVMKPGDIEAAFGVVEDLLAKYTIHLLCMDERVFIPELKDDRLVPSASHKPYHYRKGDWRFIRTGASGTTFFAPLFNDFMRHHRELLIVITDGYIYDLERLKPHVPTLWVISEHRAEPFNPPFGQVVSIRTRKTSGAAFT